MAKAKARIDKAEIVASIAEHLKKELAVVEASAKAAHEAATHEDARPENQYDTRGLEASYLAGAQRGRAAELRGMLSALETLEPKRFAADDPIAATALVEVEPDEGPRQLCFLAPVAAGLKIPLGKLIVTVITPQSPLGQALLGRTAGDSIEVAARGGLKAYEISSVE